MAYFSHAGRGCTTEQLLYCHDCDWLRAGQIIKSLICTAHTVLINKRVFLIFFGQITEPRAILREFSNITLSVNP